MKRDGRNPHSNKRSVAGRQALAHGNTLEERIRFVCDGYRRDGIAMIEKAGTRARPIHVNGRLQFIAQRSMPDFLGCTTSPHRMLVFDSKSTDSERSWRLHSGQLHQAEQLEAWARVGAIAFFLVESRPLACVFLLRVLPVVRRGAPDAVRLDFKRQVGPEAKMRQLRVRADGNGNFDFLPTIIVNWIGLGKGRQSES